MAEIPKRMLPKFMRSLKENADSISAGDPTGYAGEGKGLDRGPNQKPVSDALKAQGEANKQANRNYKNGKKAEKEKEKKRKSR